MTFKFSTIYLTEDPPNFDLHLPPASQSLTICLPLDPAGCSFIKSLTSCQVAARASLLLATPASNFGRWRPSELIPCPEEGRLKRFTVHKLKVATNNFSETKKVGEGGFSCVYEGLLGDGSRVAIKRLTRHPALGLILRAEAKLGNMIGIRICFPFMAFVHHRNMENTPSKKIAIGAARGISHLHDLRINHRDVNRANTLLDEDFEARIGDFGLALFMDDYKEKAVSEGEPNGEDAYFMSSTVGTIGYQDLGSFTGRYSVKSDVYGFGMTLLEIISRRRVCETTCLDGNELVLPQLAHALLKNEKLETLVHTNMPGGYNEGEVEKTVRLALLCTQFSPKKRPYMAESYFSKESLAWRKDGRSTKLMPRRNLGNQTWI
ncbi:hypothetical protein ACJRO7_002276 [Eucalyptus globulus]|uniref:Protein kinase domain-containing protein n=1 Tax=Eucalyptus globulus TaxID=34317 RepID=A0ABD3LZ27_EUCGL